MQHTADVRSGRAAGGAPALSVVIPTRGRGTRLLLTLSALIHQVASTPEFEIVVVDDAPDRRAVDAVLAALPASRVRPALRVVDGGGRGVAHARNTGARQAAAPVLLFLDDDTVASPRLVAAHLHAHGRADPVVAHGPVIDLVAFAFSPDPWPLRTALVGARGHTVDADDIARLGGVARSLGPRRSFIESAARRVMAPVNGYPALRWLACLGTGTSMRRVVFDDAGGFDEQYRDLGGGEDLELGLRLVAGGVAFTLIDAMAYHLPLVVRREIKPPPSRFWRRVAERHAQPELAEVGEFLGGRCSLRELAERLAPSGIGRPAS